MNKKIIYILLFCSVFLMLSSATALPLTTYKENTIEKTKIRFEEYKNNLILKIKKINNLVNIDLMLDTVVTSLLYGLMSWLPNIVIGFIMSIPTFFISFFASYVSDGRVIGAFIFGMMAAILSILSGLLWPIVCVIYDIDTIDEETEFWFGTNMPDV